MRREGKTRCDTVKRLPHGRHEKDLPPLYIINDPTTTLSHIHKAIRIGSAAHDAIKFRQECLNSYWEALKIDLETCPCSFGGRGVSSLHGIFATSRMAIVKASCASPTLKLPSAWRKISGSALSDSDFLLDRAFKCVPSSVALINYTHKWMQHSLKLAGFGQSRLWESLSDDEIAELRKAADFYERYASSKLEESFVAKNTYSTENEAMKRAARDQWKLQSGNARKDGNNVGCRAPAACGINGRKIKSLRGTSEDVLWNLCEIN
ncbi:hypothetical protein BC829DRAFT_389899 [Chytridium lagenaria]|nr:hypothetical protein BC829DRAFT_389899 [Chytridium lagenaria]